MFWPVGNEESAGPSADPPTWPSAATGPAALGRAGRTGTGTCPAAGCGPTVFGAVDGLVTNASLIAGLGGGGVSAHTVVLTGVAALVAGRSRWAPASTSR